MPTDPAPTPVTTALVAERVVALAAASPARFVRVAVDAAVEADGELVAVAVSEALDDAGRRPARVRARDFLFRRSIRLETGADDPDAGYWRWVDHAALRREVLDPFGASGRYLPTLWDAERDRATRARPVEAPPRSALIVDGPLLLRTELADAFDVRPPAHRRAGATTSPPAGRCHACPRRVGDLPRVGLPRGGGRSRRRLRPSHPSRAGRCVTEHPPPNRLGRSG